MTCLLTLPDGSEERTDALERMDESKIRKEQLKGGNNPIEFAAV